MSNLSLGKVCPTDIPYGTLLWMKKIRYAEQQAPLSKPNYYPYKIGISYLSANLAIFSVIS